MHPKIYTSFDEINNELEVLKLEKELNYHKMVLGFEKIKENIQPSSIKRELVFYIKEKLTEYFRGVLINVIPLVLSLIKKERGD